MALSTGTEELSYKGPDGCVASGIKRKVIQGVGATRTLLKEESGSLCLFDRAAGVVYTLPEAEEGLQFEFSSTVSVTSNAYKTVTADTTDFLLGGVVIASQTVAEAGDQFAADGTTIRAISEDGATKGGLLGGRYKVTGISGSQWQIEGLTVGAGTLATPFATS